MRTEEAAVPEQPTIDLDDELIPSSEMLFDGSTSREEFVRVGDGFSQHILIGRAFLQPSAAFLDLGCGNGSVARSLAGYLTAEGRYEGLDISQTSIEWLQRHYVRFPNFTFSHADVYNKMYNPAGRYAAGVYRLPFPDATFDMVLLKSVFTHMRPDDVRNYVAETSRVLKCGGRGVMTYFLLNDESRRLIEAGRDKMGLAFEYDGDPLCRVANPDIPELVVAHDERRVRQVCADAGFSLAEIAYGDWCGRQALLGLQDVIITIKD